MAAAIARHRFPEHHFSAAGLRLGRTLDSRARTVLREMNISVARLERRSLSEIDFEEFDFVVALAESARRALQTKSIKRLLFWTIDDPVFGKLATYRKSAASLMQRMDEFTKQLR
jgi:protein-tyrosine-phosphatase